MNFLETFLLLLTTSVASAATLPQHGAVEALQSSMVKRQPSTSIGVPDGECTNSPSTRNCWYNGYSIGTDFDKKTPPNGKTVIYNFEITNTTLDPDGHGEREVMLINGVYPGPTIIADWGDTLVVNVKNSLMNNGTGIHWHGVRQISTPQMDGVNGVTECPIAPGQIRTYKFKLTQFGTSWYHSHHSVQYTDGVLGTILINGPATANYDEDLGTLPLTDWYYTPAFTLDEIAQHSTTGPPVPDNILVNGTMVNADGGGQYFRMNVTQGKRYRIRLINTSADSFMHVTLDGHPFTVITSDFVPIKPYVTTQVAINIGQRYDLIISANQTVDNYWFRVGIGSCSSNAMTNTGIVIGAILHYEGADDDEPTNTTSNVTLNTDCTDETTLTPNWPQTVPASVIPQEITLNSSQDVNQDNLFRWLLNGSTMIADWDQPTLEDVLNNDFNFPPNSNVYQARNAGQWYAWWIQTVTTVALAHPIHLHGHDFAVLGSGSGVWDGTTAGLTFKNPTRRDTTTMPAGGYLILAFQADNPGTWLMHCHIAWHVAQGLSAQFLEQQDNIKSSIGDTSVLSDGCKTWNEYWNGPHEYNMTDSGLKARKPNSEKLHTSRQSLRKSNADRRSLKKTYTPPRHEM